MDAGNQTDPAAGKARTTIERTSKRELVVTRIVDGPPRLVFEAWARPELFQRWWAPKSSCITLISYEADVRTGGAYRYVHMSDGNEYWFHGSFHEVRPGELIIQTFTFDGAPDEVALERAVFEDIGDGRTRLVSTSLVDSFESRDAFVSGGMEDGVIESYERLDELLA